MAKGRFSLDEKIHTELVEGAPKIRQAEWAKLIAWMPVVEGMKRWTSTVLLAITAAGSKGISVRALSELLEIQFKHIRARLVILEEFKLITKFYTDGVLFFQQRLAEADWPPWVIPPAWAFEETPTKSTVKKSSKLFKLKAGKISTEHQKVSKLIKYGIHELDQVTDYHVQQFKASELKDKQEKEQRTGKVLTKSVNRQVTAKINTGFETTGNKEVTRTGNLSTKSVKNQTSVSNSKPAKPTENKREKRTGTLLTRPVRNRGVSGDTLGGFPVRDSDSTSGNLSGENLGTRHNIVFKEEKDSQGGSTADHGSQSQALLDMVSEDDTRRVSTARANPSRRRDLQGWQSKTREDWYGLDLLGYWLHRWRKFYGEEDPSFVGHPFSLKDRENIFRKANYRLQSFDKRFFRAKGDGAAYLDWVFDVFLPESDWFKDVLMFVQAFKLSANNFLYARFLQRGVKSKSGPSGKKGKWHHWGFEEG